MIAHLIFTVMCVCAIFFSEAIRTADIAVLDHTDEGFDLTDRAEEIILKAKTDADVF